MIGGLELFIADGSLRYDGLNESRAIAYGEEVNLSAGAPVVEPATDRHVLAFVLADVFDVDRHGANGMDGKRSSGPTSCCRRNRARSARSSTAAALSWFRTSNINLPS